MRDSDTDSSYGKRKKGKETHSWNGDVKTKTKNRVSERKASEEKNVYWNSEVQRSRKRKSTKNRKDKAKEFETAECMEIEVKQEKKLATKKNKFILHKIKTAPFTRQYKG